MFTIQCPQHGSRVLVTESRIRSLRNTDHGIQVEVECWCGTSVTIRTGRTVVAAPTATAATGTAATPAASGRAWFGARWSRRLRPRPVRSPSPMSTREPVVRPARELGVRPIYGSNL